MESLFGYVPTDKGKQDHNRRSSSSESVPMYIQLIDPRKAQNLAILLKALNVTTEEVCDALKEGNSYFFLLCLVSVDYVICVSLSEILSEADTHLLYAKYTENSI